MNDKETRKREAAMADLELTNKCQEVYNELRTAGIPVHMPKAVMYKKMSSYMGKCFQTRKRNVQKDEYEYTAERIEISKELKDQEEKKRCILAHELIHTAVKNGGHNGKFYELCKIAEKQYHYGLFHSTDFDYANIGDGDKQYLYQCFKCGRYRYTNSHEMGGLCMYCDVPMTRVEKIDFSFLDMKKSEWRKMKKEELQRRKEEEFNGLTA
ncbi:MAG: hypothetical protein IJF87_11105 [Erysipelotrichaceae bacterium]|nr:hypothetical protein [Erysipelotrichaceae bacterium]